MAAGIALPIPRFGVGASLADALACPSPVSAASPIADDPDPSDLIALLQLLCWIIQCQNSHSAAVASTTDDVNAAATSVIVSYNTSGLLPGLTPDQVSQGIDNVTAAINATSGSGASLDPGLQNNLLVTLQQMYSQLSAGGRR